MTAAASRGAGAGVAIELRHEWLQKHPTPRSGGGDFHWHPAVVDDGLRAELAEAARRVPAPAALWMLAPGCAVWARTFTEVAPADRRRYVGVVATVARGDAPAADLLAAVRLPVAAPWQPDVVEREELAGAGRRPLPARSPLDAAALTRFGDGAATLAASLWQGGVALADDPHAAALPGLVARADTWLTADERATRRSGAIVAAGTTGLEVATPATPGTRARAHYLASAWRLPAAIAARQRDFGARAWALVDELAAAEGVPVAALMDELAAIASAWDDVAALDGLLTRTGTLDAAERAAYARRAPAPLTAARDAGWLWNRLVHAWGRGFFDVEPAGRGLESRLGALLARRVVADHLFYLDSPDQPGLPQRYLRRLRWESLLPRPRLDRLTHQLARRLPGLDVQDG